MDLVNAIRERAVALTCGTENKALRKQLSDVEGRVQDLTSELSQQKKELFQQKRELSQREKELSQREKELRLIKAEVGSNQLDSESPKTGSTSNILSLNAHGSVLFQESRFRTICRCNNAARSAFFSRSAACLRVNATRASLIGTSVWLPTSQCK